MPSFPFRVHSFGEAIGHGPSRTRRALLRAVVKQNGGCGAAYCVANEYICAELARFLRLPAPPAAIVSEPGSPPGVALLDFLFNDGPPVPADPDACLHHLPCLSAGLLLFDIWIANPDRHNGNLYVNFHVSPPRLIFFDHGQALLGHIAGEGISRMAALTDKLGAGSCFLSRIAEDTHFSVWLDRIRSVPDFFIESLCDEMQAYGLTPGESAAAARFLQIRRDRLPGILSDNRGAFKSLCQRSD